jgi:hypothetical protein
MDSVYWLCVTQVVDMEMKFGVVNPSFKGENRASIIEGLGLPPEAPLSDILACAKEKLAEAREDQRKLS